jgi:hypothetical protein
VRSYSCLKLFFFISLDAFDDGGKPQLDAQHEIYKHQLSPAGFKLGSPELVELGNTVLSEAQMEQLAKHHAEKANSNPTGCGNCYGAGAKGMCCNTCQEVKDAYERMGWKFHAQVVAQCSSDAYLTNMKEQFAEEGGCQVSGKISLTRNAGHFHFAPHKKLHAGGQEGSQAGLFNLMELLSFTFDQFNVSHTVNSLSFGDNFPGINSPLDGQSRNVVDTHGMYQYFIKVVPTRYRALGQPEIESNQYSVTEHMSHLSPGSGRGLPGVYFNYEVSPIQASFEEKRVRGNSLSFAVSVCAIVGGVFTAMGIVDMFVGYVINAVWKSDAL